METSQITVQFEEPGIFLTDQLRYYATFNVRKFGLLFYKITTCLQKTITCIGLRTEQIFSVNIYNTYFSILGVVFMVPFLLFPKAPASCCKPILN